ncbi:type VII secretion target [Micromonospora soli]|uniref:type VII secretion target n=1 Tax=Micromonospora sp. NBRC 110009 TaxID=3061627 RepID=UPI002672F0DF|nr:type VII secretion target [Micromonospora sp. NBRC 110009]WKU01695.1 type VII secretion target [Micromonospora sp. NBRC 110009]
MSEEPFTVEPELLRGVARELGDDAYRLAHGLAAAPGLLVPADGWRAGTALAELEAAVQHWCGTLAAGMAATAEAVRGAADGYEAVDERAAARLAGVVR